EALAGLEIPGLERVVILEPGCPLGAAGQGAEAHPFNAPDAPGRDRMQPPAPDPWRAPFGEVVLFEYLRWRFLSQARAVANLDVSDLLAPVEGGSVFDRAAAAPQGLVALRGIRIFPWSLRKGRQAGFGDHICRRFDGGEGNARWCVAPGRLPEGTVWRLVRVTGARPEPGPPARYFRAMALRHPDQPVAAVVPKTSLVEDPELLRLATERFGAAPLRPPRERPRRPARKGRRENVTGIVTTMKNEGPFILEWLAYHRAIGVEKFLIYTNDCTDGTDRLLDLLQAKGIVEHRDNPFRKTGLKPQHAALQAAESEEMVKALDWVVCMDVDEFINIHVGEGRLADLYAAVPEANLISMTWRLFGNSDIHEFDDGFITEAFTRCAPQYCRKPHQAWGFKTLYRNIGLFKKLGVHRPKGLKPQLVDDIHWVNGSGKRLPKSMYRNAWRSTPATYGYDLVTLNHYAVRSAESFLVKRDRGRVNHVDRDQGTAYWFRMNNNAEEDRSIHRHLPRARAEFDRLMADPGIAARHAACVAAHRARIDELKARPDYAALYAELTSPRFEKLSRLHGHFGSGVFLAGPDSVPDEVVARDPDGDWFFTVDKTEQVH
ncbi:MAG: glycosyltransferase family 2 protein, partial [Alphaproteobacteria bacterium]